MTRIFRYLEKKATSGHKFALNTTITQQQIAYVKTTSNNNFIILAVL